MLNQAELEVAFKVHSDEMEKCEQSQCYWALLHLIVVLPHICSALESSDGESSGNGYKDWCRKYLASDWVSAEDWYTIRNCILHQGKTLPSPKKGESAKQSYTSFSFSRPTTSGAVLHRNVFHQPSGIHLQLDVGELKREVLIAVRKWFHVLAQSPDSQEAKNVKNHLSTMARVTNSSTPLVQGIEVHLHQSITTSSPWQQHQ